jgi:hypothetical protein
MASVREGRLSPLDSAESSSNRLWLRGRGCCLSPIERCRPHQGGRSAVAPSRSYPPRPSRTALRFSTPRRPHDLNAFGIVKKGCLMEAEPSPGTHVAPVASSVATRPPSVRRPRVHRSDLRPAVRTPPEGVPEARTWLAFLTTLHPAHIPQGVAGSPRQPPAMPATPDRKVPLSAVIPAYSRSGRNHHDRPVTPEVAGSSPVAPVENTLQIGCGSASEPSSIGGLVLS